MSETPRNDAPKVKTPVLSEAQVKTALSWLEPRMRSCCDGQRMSVMPRLMGLPLIEPRGAIVPAVALTCDGCAAMRFVRASDIPGLAFD